MDVRLIIDGPGDGAWNMALDEALLLSVAKDDRPTLRFYQWAEPTLSLGYFQAAADRARHRSSRDCPLIRRASGGGAILHDQELTYSFAMSVQDRAASKHRALYNVFHETLVQALNHWTLSALLCAADEVKTPPPFLCFQRRAKGDVLLGDCKLAGSAQRRHQGGLLQHGSVLIARSSHAPELRGISEWAPARVSAQDVLEEWLTVLKHRLGWRFHVGRLSIAQTERAHELKEQKFDARPWTTRR